MVERMTELTSLGAVEEVCKTCEAVGMVEAYMRKDDYLSTRRGVGYRDYGRVVVKVVRERCVAAFSRLCEVINSIQALLLRTEEGMAGSPAMAFSSPASWKELGADMFGNWLVIIQKYLQNKEACVLIVKALLVDEIPTGVQLI